MKTLCFTLILLFTPITWSSEEAHKENPPEAIVKADIKIPDTTDLRLLKLEKVVKELEKRADSLEKKLVDLSKRKQ